MCAVKRAPLFRKTCAHMAVEEVLPWLPATAMTEEKSSATAPSSCIRERHGIPRFFASASSGSSIGTASVQTTVCTPTTAAGSCPMRTGMPSFSSMVISSLTAMSLPLTSNPSRLRYFASELMLTPPMPTKCTLCPFKNAFKLILLLFYEAKRQNIEKI